MHPRVPWFWLRLCVLLAALSGGVWGQTAPSKEYQVKAVFLFNFIQFVEWPEGVFTEANSPMYIGVLGDDPFGQALDEVVKGESIGGRSLAVVRSRRLEELAGCHLIFISKSETRRLDNVLAQLGSRPVLTVSELDGFANRGGMIAFYSEGKRIRFEINPGVAKRVDLKISSELLGLGRIAGPNPAEGRL
jgi:hypothetical protein